MGTESYSDSRRLHPWPARGPYLLSESYSKASRIYVGLQASGFSENNKLKC
jgi:hypothetical protein